MAVDGVEEPTEEKKHSFNNGIAARAFNDNRDEWPIILLGMITTGLAGAFFRLKALIFSEVTSLLEDPTKASMISFWACMPKEREKGRPGRRFNCR
jgi:hypothetical protein